MRSLLSGELLIFITMLADLEPQLGLNVLQIKMLTFIHVSMPIWSIHTYYTLYVYIHTYIQDTTKRLIKVYIHTYMHTYIHTYIHIHTRYYKEMAEVFEADNNTEMAMESYQQAADMFSNDNKKSNANQCLLKVLYVFLCMHVCMCSCVCMWGSDWEGDYVCNAMWTDFVVHSCLEMYVCMCVYININILYICCAWKWCRFFPTSITFYGWISKYT